MKCFFVSLKMHSTLFVIFLCFGFLAKSQGYYFPPANSNWDTLSPNTLNWCEPKIDSLYSFLDAEQTKSFLVLKDGKIVLEKYFGNHNGTTNWVWYSAGKSLRATLIGIAQSEGDLDINDKTSQYLGQDWSSMSSMQEDSVRVFHHLSMTTGLNEQYFSCTDDSCLTYKVPAGSRWFYHNAAYNLTKDILEAATNTNHNVYTQQKIKTPIGMNSGIWLPAGDNDFFYSRARDMARFGILIANKGVWNGNTILTDTNYFNQMIGSSQSLNPSYGYLWWLNGKNSIIPPGDSLSYPSSLAPDAPADVVLAAGALGQYISISKSRGLIIIRQGLSFNPSLIGNDLHNEIWKYLADLECNFTSIEENPSEFVLYPNPASSEVSIQLLVKSKVEIYDALGERLYAQELAKGKTRLDVSEYCSGIYFVSISNPSYSKIQKLIVSQ